MPAYDGKCRKFQCDLVNVRNRTTNFAGTEWTSVPDLGEERDVQFNAFHVKRPVVCVCCGQAIVFKVVRTSIVKSMPIRLRRYSVVDISLRRKL